MKINEQLTGGYKGVVDAANVAYSYKEEEGIEKIDKSVKKAIEELNTSIDEVTNLNSDILAAANQINSLNATINTAKNELTEIVENAENDIADIKLTANLLKRSLDTDAQFQVLSQSEYTAIIEKDPNTMYFIYGNQS